MFLIRYSPALFLRLYYKINSLPVEEAAVFDRR
jgi:hypothetical protein